MDDFGTDLSIVLDSILAAELALNPWALAERWFISTSTYGGFDRMSSDRVEI